MYSDSSSLVVARVGPSGRRRSSATSSTALTRTPTSRMCSGSPTCSTTAPRPRLTRSRAIPSSCTQPGSTWSMRSAPGNLTPSGVTSRRGATMSEITSAPTTPGARFGRWLLKERIEEVQGPEAKEGQEQHPWWQVVCLTGVDYFSTLGYIPGIAALAAGVLSPVATLFIVLLTLFGALPMYRRVAEQSPHGQGSIAMLERLLSFWKGKLLVLVLLGFVATAWLVTITLSSADAAVHISENPLVPGFLHDQEVFITVALLVVLGAIFLKGFKEAIGVAVMIVGVYLLLNIVVMAVGFYEIATHPQNVVDWQDALFSNYGNPLLMIVASLLVFPRLALGLSGF